MSGNSAWFYDWQSTKHLSETMTHERTADPWTTQVWTAQVHLHTDFFFSRKYYTTTRPAVGCLWRCRTALYVEFWLCGGLAPLTPVCSWWNCFYLKMEFCFINHKMACSSLEKKSCGKWYICEEHYICCPHIVHDEVFFQDPWSSGWKSWD